MNILVRLSLFLLLSANVVLHAQSPASDTTFLADASRQSIRHYERFMKGQHAYFNGSAYVEPDRTNEEHPFFMTEDWSWGSITFDGEHYDSLTLLYDLTIDELVTESATYHQQIVNREKLEDFYIGSAFFRKFKTADVGNTLPRTGFYQILYDGKTQIICMRQKFKYSRIESREVEITFEEKNKFFLRKGDLFFPVKGKGSMLKLMADHRREVATFIRKNRINFSKNRDAALQQVAKYYDELTARK